MTQPPDIEADGFTTCHPPLTGQARTAMTLSDARAVRADLAHHPDADVIEAARTIARLSPEPSEQADAAQLLAIMHWTGD